LYCKVDTIVTLLSLNFKKTKRLLNVTTLYTKTYLQGSKLLQNQSTENTELST